MEVVQNFNREMKSLLDHRPPVSRQKMSMITKSAIRGIKFYKHIVQSVEKFIQKCSPDYKVPGLYVMDAIIRQSRHQYGAERDVFAPRFLKNLLPTFQQLFRCDEKDRPLVIRVLNLWLKNETFAPEVIQSLLSLADNPEDPNLLALAQAQISVAANNQSTSGSAHRPKRSHHHHHHRQRQSSGQADLGLDEDHQPIVGDEADYDFNAEAGAMAPSAAFDSTTVEANQRSSANQGSGGGGGGIISSVAELLQKFQDADDVRDQINQLQTLQDKILQQSSLLTQQQMIDPEILGQLQVLMEELTKTARAAVEREQEAQRTKDVVAYDYGDDSDDEDNLGAGSNGFHRRAGAAGSAAALSAGGGGSSIDQNFLDQLQQMTEMLAQTRVLQEQLQSARLKQQQQEQQQQQLLLQEEIEAGQQADIDQRFQQHQQHYYQQQQQQPLHISYEEGEIDEEAARAAMTSSSGGHKPNHYRSINNDGEELEIRAGLELEQQQQHTGRGRRDRRGSGSGASRRPRSPPTQASAPSATATASSSSSSRRRRRSHSGGRGESSERRRKERKRKALPRLRNGRLSIVSATIFIGKLQKSTTEAKLRSVLEEYGQVQALVLIASRGCGFVVYSKRKHAAKAIDRLRTCRIDGASLRVAWAPNKGIKDTELKDFWDEEEGCTYIPFDKFPRDESWRDLLQGGAFVDQDSVPLELVDLVRSPTPNPADPDARSAVNKTPSVHQTADLSVPAPGLVMPPPPPPPLPPLAQPLQQLPHHLLMMPPPPMLPPPPPPPPSTQPQAPIPHFSAFIPPPPIPPPSRTAVSSSLSPALPGDGKTIDSPAASTAVRQPLQGPPPLMHQPRTTLLPAPPHQQPHQYVRTPIPAQRPPPGAGFFRGAGIGSGILPMPMPPPRPLLPFGPRGGNIGAGWRGRGL